MFEALFSLLGAIIGAGATYYVFRRQEDVRSIVAEIEGTYDILSKSEIGIASPLSWGGNEISELKLINIRIQNVGNRVIEEIPINLSLSGNGKFISCNINIDDEADISVSEQPTSSGNIIRSFEVPFLNSTEAAYVSIFHEGVLEVESVSIRMKGVKYKFLKEKDKTIRNRQLLIGIGISAVLLSAGYLFYLVIF